MLAAFTHDACLAHASPGHPERPERLAAARRGLQGLADIVEAPEADLSLVARAHHPAHVERVRAACAAGAHLDADTYTTAGASWRAALRSAGAAVEAARSAARGTPAFALGRPPGHHATRGSAMGFCLLNNAAIAAADLAASGRRVAIVDMDVHHGNGTQDVVYERSDVLFVSLHGWPLYPGTGAVEEHGAHAGIGATLNLPLPAGTASEGWLDVFERAALPKVRAHRPDVILVSAGFDADARDPLGNLALAPRCFHEAMTRLRAITPRIAAVLEGGYDLAAVEEGVAESGRAMAGEASRHPVPSPGGPAPWRLLEARVLFAHPDLVEAGIDEPAT